MNGRGRAVALTLAGALLAGGCSRGGSPEGDAPPVRLEPRFAPATTVEGAPGAAVDAGGTTTSPAATPGGGAAAPPPSDTGPGTPTTATTAAPAGPAVPAAPTEASLRDRERDVTPSPLDPPPPWADLVSARLLRTTAGFELRVGLGGGAAPERTADDDHTMNIGSFYDLDGDGGIDTEVWLNVASTGWGATWFDNVGEGGGFQEGSGVTITVEGAEVVARFPSTHLGGAERFRWALASEWGRYTAIGTAAAARDDLPDGDAAAAFPAP